MLGMAAIIWSAVQTIFHIVAQGNLAIVQQSCCAHPSPAWHRAAYHTLQDSQQYPNLWDERDHACYGIVETRQPVCMGREYDVLAASACRLHH